MKNKAFFITFKGLSMNETTQFFLEGERPTLNNFLQVLLLCYDYEYM